MNQNKVIETIGNITKMEHLYAIKDQVMDNTLVLKTSNPFPGLKNLSAKKNTNLDSYFIVLNYRYAPEKIARINQLLHTKFKLERFPSYGEIITKSRVYPCIRLKMVDLEKISGMQEYLKIQDLKFMTRKEFDATCRIKIIKSFKLLEVAEKLYRDLSEREKIYITINKQLNWKHFDFIVRKVKTKIENKAFDAALGVIYRFDGPENVIRLYDADISLDRALLLKKHFLSEVRKEVSISAIL